jgi:hypothetical protein
MKVGNICYILEAKDESGNAARPDLDHFERELSNQGLKIKTCPFDTTPRPECLNDLYNQGSHAVGITPTGGHSRLGVSDGVPHVEVDVDGGERLDNFLKTYKEVPLNR